MIQQINCPEDKLIRYFLWASYFHDSNISDIRFSRYGRSKYSFPNRVELEIESILDMDEDESIPDTHREAREFIKKHQDRYIYRMVFEDCLYFSSERLFFANSYKNAEFLDSALLRSIQADFDKNKGRVQYYHFRIVFDDGFMDLVFSKFRLVKKIGKVKCPDYDFITDYPEWRLRRLKDGDKESETLPLDAEWLKELAEKGKDEERGLALNYLVRNLGFSMIEEARNSMCLNWMEYSVAREAAVWVIGLQGDQTDAELLFSEYLAIDKRHSQSGSFPGCPQLMKRRLLDAIELIKYRTEGPNDLRI